MTDALQERLKSLFPDLCSQLHCDGMLSVLARRCVTALAVSDTLQERLKTLFPDLMETESQDDCSWFQWAFACVRSRALK